MSGDRTFEQELQDITKDDTNDLAKFEGFKRLKRFLESCERDPSKLTPEQIEALPELRKMCDETDARFKTFFE